MPLEIGNRAFIGLGSNLNNPPDNLAEAIRRLENTFQTPVTASAVYFSEPAEVHNQPWFFNQVVYFNINPSLTPTIILKTLKMIELEMGRVPSFRYGPRLIDLDLLFFRNWVFESAFLTVPHPKIAERLFVLTPLLELEPNLIHPRLKISLNQIMNENSFNYGHCEKVTHIVIP